MTGTPLAKRSAMKQGITYKEITLIVGIVVAIAAAMIFFGTTPESGSITGKVISTPTMKMPSYSNLIESTIEILF